ncbi:MAG: peptidylprolyl isomerase [Bdellovibrionales bacterium]|nr:peptidylprolyl isomerase [Bdellovibrionales bacterium]
MASQHRTKRVLSVLISSGILIFIIAAYFWIMIPIMAGGDLERVQTQVQDLRPEIEVALQVGTDGLSRAWVTLQTTRGKIRFKFFTEDAPKTVRRVARLIDSGFYNGLTFHRAEPGFVIQGGDPTGTGNGGSGVLLPAEFNQRKHVAGAVAMARKWEDPNSADSQFYITLGNQFDLDGKYTVIGQVMEGLDVMNEIRVGDRMTSVTIEAQ